MKSKVKKRCKQVLTGLLALSMLCGILPQNAVSVSAATTAVQRGNEQHSSPRV